MTERPRIKAAIAGFREAAANFEPGRVRSALSTGFAPDADIHLCHPFGDMTGPQAVFETALAPLARALPDLERRDMIVVAGTTPEGQDWVGCMGNYMGTFAAPFLDIPPMMQAGAWPMAPQLGRFLCTPGPMSCDGLAPAGDAGAALAHVTAMLGDLCRHPAEGGPEVMKLDTYWHPRVNWYGPAGIGTARGIAGFRHWHQIPFLRAMPDRKLDGGADLMSHWFAEGDHVAETGWPNMRLTITGDGWMGIAPAGQEVTLRSLDFWRLENGLIRENWVLVDLLDLYAQIGVDVLGRMREFNKARSIAPIPLEAAV